MERVKNFQKCHLPLSELGGSRFPCGTHQMARNTFRFNTSTVFPLSSIGG